MKIEGRLKSPEYVASITHHYRQAIDSAVSGTPVFFEPKQIEEMELTFSRGFLRGGSMAVTIKMLVPATSSANRGVFLGHVRKHFTRTYYGFTTGISKARRWYRR